MDAPASPEPPDAERLEELNAELSRTIRELILFHAGRSNHPLQEEAPPPPEPPNSLTRIKRKIAATWLGELWHFIRRNRTALSEFSILVLTAVTVLLGVVSVAFGVLSIVYAARANNLADEGINLAKVAINIGQSWSKTSYENAVLNTWSAVQAACKENQACGSSYVLFSNLPGYNMRTLYKIARQHEHE
ncbi:hypothetical protein V8F33_008862 [Rhypophila sp. PSN 637]